MRRIVVTGTDTGVGKTIVTAALAANAAAAGLAVAVVKVVQTGAGDSTPPDLDEIRRLSGVEDVHELARFDEPLAPATAARRQGAAGVTAAEAARAVRALDDRDLVLVEGAGGLLVQLHADGSTIADVASALDAPLLVVARAGLGTLNHTALTCEAIAARGGSCLGVVIGSWPRRPDLAERCNLADLPAYTGQRVLGRIPEGSAQLEAAAFAAGATGWINLEETP